MATHNWKGEALHYLDIGLMGTFHGLKESETEKGYVYLEYYPLGKSHFGVPKKEVYPQPILEDSVHFVVTKKNIKGVEKRIVLIYTGEEGSIVRDIVDANILKQNEELKEEIRQLKMEVASAKQESEDLRSGMGKTIASVKSMEKMGRGRIFDSPYSPGHPIQQGDEYNDYEF